MWKELDIKSKDFHQINLAEEYCSDQNAVNFSSLERVNWQNHQAFMLTASYVNGLC